jgi:hypothetical protein
MRKSLFNDSLYSHPEIWKFQGVTNLPALNGISSRDSKKEEARRRDINKNIAAKVGRRSSSFCRSVWSLIFFFVGCWGLHQSDLGGIKASTR